MSTHWTIRLVSLLGLVLLVACGGGSTSDTGGTGTLLLSITDAPFPGPGCLAEANLTVSGVQAKGDGGWVEIPLDSSPVTLNLLDLQGGLTAPLGGEQVPAGAYREIRLLIDSAKLKFADPEEVGYADADFKVPSGMSSGLKIKIDPPLLVAPGQTAEIILDVDVAGSFHTTGLGGTPTCEDLRAGEIKVIFRPVVRALNESVIGMVTGTVHDDEDPDELLENWTVVAGAQVAAVLHDPDADPPVFSDDDVVSQALSATDGSYALLLTPESYDIWVLAPVSSEPPAADPVWTRALPNVGVSEGGVLLDQDINLYSAP